MTALMHKTKRELVEFIQEIEGNLGQIEERKTQLEGEKSRLEAAMAGMRKDRADLETEVEALHGKIDRLKIENEALIKKAAMLQEKNAVMARENGETASVRGELEKALAEMSNRLETGESRYRAQYELFRSFVDDDLKKILLIDTAYTIVYINRAVRPVLGIADTDPVSGRRFFDFMTFKDAIKVKEKIDKAFLEGETEKVKNVKFRCEDGMVREFKLKMSRVRYQERPSVKIVFK
ncbi:PAS domain S-box protein [Desulfococcus sp.]|uniref:PAS domain S-box protein n=1 Tax=Desulfococcus sp. TaxID=2025834 RepID=UPI003593E880